MDVIQGTSFAASEVEGGVVDLDSKPSDMPAPATTVCVALSAQHASVHSSAPTGDSLVNAVTPAKASGGMETSLAVVGI